MADLLVRRARPVPLADDPRAHLPPASDHSMLVDVLVRDGRIAWVREASNIGRHEGDGDVLIVDADGRWIMPGLWDAHVHVDQWALASTRLDLSAAGSVGEAVDLVRRRLEDPEPLPQGILIGYGHRPASWTEQPGRADLDALTDQIPIILISGDAHHGWLNTAGFQLLGVSPRAGVVAEGEWFAMYDRLGRLPGAQRTTEEAVRASVARANERGIVGMVDLEFARPWVDWPRRYAEGVVPPTMRIRAGVYPGHLDEVLDAGLRTGDPLEERGLVRMGPLKIITDGSLNTRTAWCCQPYADAHLLDHPRGAPNLPPQEVLEHTARAHAAGLEAALHAIGDAAVAQVLDIFETTGARGSLEHAQLVDLADLPRWGRLPVVASMQPAHLLDDRGVTEQCWPDRTDRTFALAPMLAAGIDLVLGSDAPVSPLDPWLTMAAAVHRAAPGTGAPSWHPELALSPHQALAASVDGQRLRPGARGDFILLQDSPFAGSDSAAQAHHLTQMRVDATIVAGHLLS